MGVAVRGWAALVVAVAVAMSPVHGDAAPRAYDGPRDVAADPTTPEPATAEPVGEAGGGPFLDFDGLESDGERTPPPVPDVDGSIDDDDDDGSIEDDEGSIEDDEGSIEGDEGSIEDDESEPTTQVVWRNEPEGEVAWRRIRGGALLLAGGALLVIGAVILGSTDPCRRLAGNGCQTAARTRAAVTMAVPGTAILVGGAVLTTIGVRQRARVRASLATPLSGNRTWGVGLVGRF